MLYSSYSVLLNCFKSDAILTVVTNISLQDFHNSCNSKEASQAQLNCSIITRHMLGYKNMFCNEEIMSKAGIREGRRRKIKGEK